MQYRDISTPAFFANPYPVYDEMRETGPIVQLAPKLFSTGRYSVAEALLLDRRFGKGIEAAVMARYGAGVIEQPPFRTFRSMLPGMNPPKHTRLRALLMKSFNARQIDKFRQASFDISNRLVDNLTKSSHGDLVKDFAFVLPMQTICTILDVPLEDASLFKEAADHVSGAIDVTPLSPEKLEQAKQSAIELEAYFAKIIRVRRENPGEDLISQMILAEEEGERMTDEEIVANVCFLFVAGHETTENMIGNALIALHRQPEQLQRAISDLSILPSVVNECMRFDSSVQMAQRVALEDVEFEGLSIERGNLICVCLGAANRDPEKFSNPGVLKIDRDEGRMLSFGSGLHFCLGARLATLEIEAALATLFTRLPDMRLTNLDDLRYRHNSALRGVDALHASW